MRRRRKKRNAPLSKRQARAMCAVIRRHGKRCRNPLTRQEVGELLTRARRAAHLSRSELREARRFDDLGYVGAARRNAKMALFHAGEAAGYARSASYGGKRGTRSPGYRSYLAAMRMNPRKKRRKARR